MEDATYSISVLWRIFPVEDASAKGGGHGTFRRANGVPAFAALVFQHVEVCVEVFFDVCVRQARPLIPRWRRLKGVSGILLAFCVTCGSSKRSLQMRGPLAGARPVQQASAVKNVPAPYISLTSSTANQGYES